MDELEKKRLAKHSARQVEDQEFDKQLAQTLNIEVSDDLAEKILLKQRIDSQLWYSNYKPMLAIAASFSLVTFLFFQPSDNKLSNIALKHVYHELDHLATSDEPVDRAKLFDSIKSLGLDINSLPDKISYAGQCTIGNKRGIHIVARVNDKPVTLFLSSNPVKNHELFDDNRFYGEIYPTASGSMILVGESMRDLETIHKQTNSG